MASLLFVVLNGHLMVLMAVVRSFEVFPVNQNFLEALSLMKLYGLGGELFASGFWIALPMLGMLMFANLALGIVSRVAPQMNILPSAFPSRSPSAWWGWRLRCPCWIVRSRR